MNLAEVQQYITDSSPESRIYLGCDSERILVDGVWMVDFCLAVVIHINGNNGGKVFGGIVRERDYDKKLSRPALRLMTEVYKLSELYLELADVLEDRLVELHCDINPSESYGSSCVAAAAIGYIKGTCAITPVIKPNAWCASNVADRGIRGKMLFPKMGIT